MQVLFKDMTLLFPHWKPQQISSVSHELTSMKSSPPTPPWPAKRLGCTEAHLPLNVSLPGGGGSVGTSI